MEKTKMSRTFQGTGCGRSGMSEKELIFNKPYPGIVGNF